jgi:hypothetical protein
MSSQKLSINQNQLSSINANPGSVLVSDGSGSVSWENDLISANSDMGQFLELVLAALGHDIKYDDFVKMDDNERKAILRDIKIKNILC